MEDQPGNQAASETQDPEETGFQLEDMQSLMEAQEAGFQALRRGQTTTGTIVSIADDAVLVDVGLKSEGIIRREELGENGDDLPDLKLGQEVIVQVLQPDSSNGPILSLRRARREQTWVDVEALAQNGGVIEGPVVDYNRGGALVEVGGIRGFVPVSQLASLPPAGSGEGDETERRLAELVGKSLRVKVLEANHQQNRLILSERAASLEERARRKEDLMQELRPGQIRRGTVRNVTTFGAFVDLGGADGLVHVSELSYERINDPRTVLSPGQEIDVFVLDVRPQDQKISLSLKRAMADPWESVESRYQPGENVQATITRLVKFGAFAQIEPGVEGLIHLSELADATPRDAAQVVSEGQTVEAKIIHIDRARRRLGLSIRQLRPAIQEMTVEEWAAEQNREEDPTPTAFHALAGLSDTEGAEEGSSPQLEIPEEPAATADDTEYVSGVNTSGDGEAAAVLIESTEESGDSESEAVAEELTVTEPVSTESGAEGETAEANPEVWSVTAEQDQPAEASESPDDAQANFESGTEVQPTQTEQQEEDVSSEEIESRSTSLDDEPQTAQVPQAVTDAV